MKNVMIQETKTYQAGNIKIERNPANEKWQFRFDGKKRSFNTLKEVKAFLINKGVEQTIIKTSAPASKSDAETEEKSKEEVLEEVKKESKIADLREQEYRCVGITHIPNDSQIHLIFERRREEFVEQEVV